MNDLQRKYGRQAMEKYRKKDPVRYAEQQIRYNFKKLLSTSDYASLEMIVLGELKKLKGGN